MDTHRAYFCCIVCLQRFNVSTLLFISAGVICCTSFFFSFRRYIVCVHAHLSPMSMTMTDHPRQWLKKNKHLHWVFGHVSPIHDCLRSIRPKYNSLCSAVNDGCVEVKLSTGEVRRGELLQGFREKFSRAPWDLHSTCAGPLSMRCLCVVAPWHPQHKRLKYYVLLVLPFGSTFGARNSVYTFGTVAFAPSCVLVSLFKLSLAQYVDDFPQVEPRVSAESALVFEAVLALLGWEVKQAGGKTPAFEQSFVA